MYKSFYEQFFFTRFNKSLQECYSSVGSATALFQGKQGYWRLRCSVLTRFAVEEFFPTSRLMQERRKVYYRWATYKKSIKICRQVFCPTIRSIQGKRRIFMQRATYKGNVPCVLNLFFVHEYWDSEATCLSWSIGSYETSSTRKPCAKAVPEMDSFTQQKQYHKRTTLRTLKLPLWSICSKEGPNYCLGAKRKKAVIRQATNAIYGMGTLTIPLQSIRSEEGPHYCLEAKRKEAVIRQATINPIHEFGYPLVIPYPGCTA
jgi:hypothetical protein